MSGKSKIDEILDQGLATPLSTENGPKPSPNSIDLDSIVSTASATHGVPEVLIHAVIKQESGGNPKATSGVGAHGLMQLMPATAKSLGVKNSSDPIENVNGGTAYLRKLHDQFGSWDLALAAYNAGPGNVNKYKGIPPFKETQNYVKNIMSNVGAVPAAGSSVDSILDAAGIPPMTQEQLDARPKIDASGSYDPNQIIADLFNPMENTGTKALAVTSGIVGRPFAGPPTALDLLKILMPEVAATLDATPGAQAVKAISHPFDKAEEEEPVAAGVGQLLGFFTPSVGAKVASKVKPQVGRAILNRFLKAKSPEVAPYVAKHVGVVKNLDEFIAKNEQAITNNATKLQKILDAHPEHMGNLPKNMRVQDIVDAAEYLESIRAIDASQDLLNIASRAEQQGNKLSVADLNKVKQYFQRQSYGKSGPLSSDQSKVYQDWATEARSTIESFFGKAGKTGKESAKLGNEVAILNQDIATGFKTKKLLEKTIERDTSSGGFSNLDTAVTILTGGAYAPVAVANKLLKTSAVATAANKGSSKFEELTKLLLPKK